MKLKLVVASMSVLGLICSSAFAADEADQNATTKHKAHHHKVSVRHHHHHMGRHHESAKVEAMEVRHEGYANPCPCPCNPSPCAPECRVYDCYNLTMEEMSQNLGRAVPTVNCNCPIALAGGINFDWLTGNRTRLFAGKNIERFSLNDAYINIYGNVNCWTKAFMSLSYNNTSIGVDDADDNASVNGVLFPSSGFMGYSSVYNRSPNGNREATHRVNMEQAYITFAKFDCSPFFVQLGKQFLDYGRYRIHPQERTMVQVLTESLRTAAEVGFIVPMGFHGSISVFDDPVKKTTDTRSSYNFAAALGYSNYNDCFGYDAGVDYMYNMFGVNDVTSARNLNALIVGGTGLGNYVTRVGGIAAYADVNSGPFLFGARYTTALNRFNSNDFLYSGKGARPWAFDLDVGYDFCLCNLNNLVYVGYQQSGEASNFNLPRNRWIAGWGTEVLHNTSVALELGRDHDYSRGNNGTGTNSGTVGVRTAVKFG